MSRLQAVVAVIRRGEKILIIKRGPESRRQGYWGPLSGTVEPGETQAEALVREIREEVGLEARAGRKVWESSTDDGRYVLHWWTAEAETGEPEPDLHEVAEARWVTAAEYFELEPIFTGDNEFFERVLPSL